MAEEENQKEQKKGKGYWTKRILTGIWNRTPWGRAAGMFTQETKESKLEPAIVLQQFKTEFQINKDKIQRLTEIETNWGKLDPIVFPYKGKKMAYSKEPDTECLTDLYRRAEYFRSERTVKEEEHITAKEEAHIFETEGTVRLKDVQYKLDVNQLKKNIENNIRRLEEEIRRLEAKGSRRTEEEEDELNNSNDELETARRYLDNLNRNIFEFPALKDLEANEYIIEGLNGRVDSIVAFGLGNLTKIRKEFESLRGRIDLFASSGGVAAPIRTSITQLMTQIGNTWGSIETGGIEKMEKEHQNKLDEVIIPSLTKIGKVAIAVEAIRPPPIFIRFPHTYKVIKQVRLEEIEVDAERIMDDPSSDLGFKVVTVRTKVPKPIYFDADKNPYHENLQEAENEIRALIGNRNLQAEIAKLERALTIQKSQIEKVEERIKNMISAAIDTDFKVTSLDELNKILESSKNDEEIKEFIGEIGKRMRHIIRILKVVKIKSIRLSADWFELNQGKYRNRPKYIKSIEALLEELESMDDDTFEQYVNDYKNDFEKWIRGTFRAYEIASQIKDKKTRRDMLSALNKTFVILLEEYGPRLEDLFNFTVTKLQEFDMQFDRDDISNKQNRLKRPAAPADEKRQILIELYNGLVKAAKDKITTRNDKLREFIAKIKNDIESLASSNESEHNIRLSELINSITEGLEKFKVSPDEIKNTINSINGVFLNAISTREVNRLKKSVNVIYRKSDEFKISLRKMKELEIKKRSIERDINNPNLRPRLGGHPLDFKKFPREVARGLDENGWPLEVIEDPPGSGTWKVLLDIWWTEISQNPWHEATIRKVKKDDGGEAVWKEKVEEGIRRHGIREVPEEFVGEIDPLDKAMFIYNEWDSFRDDFRDGRYHKHSKTSMDYIIAGTKGMTPITKINYQVDTQDKQTRINFRPIYVTMADIINDLKPLGTVHSSITKSQIPDDERLVSRRYEMKTERVGEIPNLVRIPTHLNPAFDRAALGSEFIHWGRMYYYETADGINKWSENPFPHVATRGIAKYLIDLTIRSTFSFNEAREILRSNDQKWDYAIRHWGPPFTTDPLGEALPGQGPLAGAKGEE